MLHTLCLLAQATSSTDHGFFRADNALAFCVVLFTAAVVIIVPSYGFYTYIVCRRAREETKRELAALVAAGSLDADTAIAMLNAGEKRCEGIGSLGNRK